MAKKSANIMVRVEPEVKAKAEAVMSELGVPASVVVNMLYKHIIRTGGIPFPVSIMQESSEEASGQNDVTKTPKENVVEKIIDIPGLRAPKGAKKVITVI